MAIRIADQPGDLGWIVQAHGEMYSRDFGWSVAFEEMVAGVMGRYATDRDPELEQAWVAEVDGRRAGCIACTRDEDPHTARLRVLLVDPAYRGLGLGRDLVETCLGFAKAAGYERMTLFTIDTLVSARKIYEAAGFVLVDEKPNHDFGLDLVGQNWELELPN
jgi:GNAT superfamily N-acetyltransferase